MRSALRQAIVALVESAPEGMPMGELVDTLEHNGYAIDEVEQEIWSMLAQRRLTPAGFVRRRIRRGAGSPTRSYEFLLLPWSPSLDGQLELGLESGS